MFTFALVRARASAMGSGGRMESGQEHKQQQFVLRIVG